MRTAKRSPTAVAMRKRHPSSQPMRHRADRRPKDARRAALLSGEG